MKKSAMAFLIILLAALAACSTSEGTGSGLSGSNDTEHSGGNSDESGLDIPLLSDVYSSMFDIGAAVQSTEYGGQSFDTVYEDLLPQFTSLTPENSMKPSVIQPSEGNFSWSATDRIVEYASEHSMKVRGHVLVWHNQTDSWMTEGGRSDAFRRMKTHIETVMNRYKDSIYCWDVVNEAVSDGDHDVYREDSLWYTAYGNADYIQDAFDLARSADPDALLFYNDYSVVNKDKRDRIVTMINDLNLKEHGLDGIGIQAHWNLDWPGIDDIQSTIDTFHDMGLVIHITELDIDCFNGTGNTEGRSFDDELKQRLADRYDEIFTLFRENSTKISSVSFWGIADDHTWLDHF